MTSSLFILNAAAAAAAAAAANQQTDSNVTPDDLVNLLEAIGTGIFVVFLCAVVGIGMVWTLDKIFGDPS